jgi:hypothetical protein
LPRATAKKSADLSGDGAGLLDKVEPLELRPTGHPEGSVDVNLTGLLCRLLALPDDKGKTWAQKVAEGWIANAVTGEPRAIVDIFDRTGKGRPAEAPVAEAPQQVKGRTISEILEVLSRDRQDPASV